MFKNNKLESIDLIPDSIRDMLSMHLGDTINFDENLSASQIKAFDLFKENKNLLILGSAGVGKSKIVKTMQEYIRVNTNKKMYVTSTTGISAYNISGVTIHSLLGIGTGEMEVNALIKKVAKKKLYRERILNIDILVIDEASMLSGDIFEKLHLLCQNIRKNKLFFGGIQMVFSMDPLQLLPVFNRNNDLYKNIDERLIVESPIFNKYLKKDNIVMLKENFRQKNDPIFINLLGRIRDGTYTADDIKIVTNRKIIPKNASDHVHLVTSNKKAQIINDTELNKLKTDSIKFSSTFNSNGVDEETTGLLLKELQFQFNQKGITELVLKKGCRVMLIKNIDVESGLVNGALGTIIDFSFDHSINHLVPIVEFDGKGIKQAITPTVWELNIDNCTGTATQIPLMLAYSITIHKSQSISLDSAVLDLADAFCDHQVFVALSRLRSLDGLYLKSFNPAKIKVNKKMKDYLENLEL